MLEEQTAKEILEITANFWAQEVKSDGFRAIATGKEIGHRIADLVDEKTSQLLQQYYDTKQEHGPKGLRTRSMGDIWVKSAGIYNPLNIKAGEIGKNGQPNLVSLKRLLSALIARQIDSYYVLIVKMTVGDEPTVAVYLVDILGYLDHTTFDSGPGQMMLKEKGFYEAMERGERPSDLTVADKIEHLIEMLEDADRRLLQNRKRVYDRIRKSLDAYRQVRGHIVDQARLHLE